MIFDMLRQGERGRGRDRRRCESEASVSEGRS